MVAPGKLAAFERADEVLVPRLFYFGANPQPRSGYLRSAPRLFPDLDLVRQARAAFGGELLAAGGVRDKRDIEALSKAGADGAVVGRAWLEGMLEG